MHVTAFLARNAGPFRSLELTFCRGTVGIFGKNGRGKSTLLNLIYGAIVNDFTSRFEGVKLDRVRDTAGPKDKSYVAVTLAHEGHAIEIVRGLRPARHALRVDGGAAITDARKIEEELRALLRVDRKLLDLFVFKEAHRIYDFLAVTDGERKKAFQTLCRTEVCGELWDCFGAFLNQDAEVRTEVVDNSDEIAGQIAALEARAEALGRERDTWGRQLLDDARRDRLRRRLARAERHALLAAEHARLEAKRPALAERLAHETARRDRRRKKTERLGRQCARAASRVTAAEAALRAWDEYERWRKHRRTLEAEQDALAAEVAARPEIPWPATLPPGWDPEQAGADLAWLTRELERARRVLKTFDASGCVACPTCGTPVTAIGKALDEHRGTVALAPQTIRTIEANLKASRAYAKAIREFETWRAGFEARRAANAKALAALPCHRAPAGDRAELRAYLDAAAAQRRDYEASRDRLTAREAAAAQAEARLAHCDERLAELAAQAGATAVPAEKVEAARRRLADHDAAAQQAARLAGQVAEIEDRLAGLGEDLKRLRRRLRRAAKLKRLAGIVARARAAVHPDGLPNRVARINLARMEGEINERLGLFGDPFWVETGDDLTFTVHRPGLPPFPAGRLSTGQRVVLAVPFWLAVASLGRGDLGMLALDEPTANLDEENRAYLAEALAQLTAAVRGRLQVLVVSHADNLRSHFEQVIDLEVLGCGTGTSLQTATS